MKKMNLKLLALSACAVGLLSQEGFSVASDIPVTAEIVQKSKSGVGIEHPTRIRYVSVWAHLNKDDEGEKIATFSPQGTFKNGETVHLGTITNIKEGVNFLSFNYDVTSSGYDQPGTCVYEPGPHKMLIPIGKGKSKISSASFFLNDIEHKDDEYKASCYTKNIKRK